MPYFISQAFWRLVGRLRTAATRRPRLTVRDIKPFDPRHLPPRFDVPHAVAFFLHDELASLVRDLEESGASSVSIDLSEEERESLQAVGEGTPLFDWLLEHGRQDVIDDLTYRQLTMAVVADACHFLSESLIASEKGKTTVAYSLLRKPLKESLLLLEWLCAEPAGFLAKFHGETTDGYVLNRLPVVERRRIIDAAVAMVDVPGITSEVLWTIRYAGEYPNSLETLWTKATHLVTSVKASATEPGNLNFVFSSTEAKDEQWDHYYRIVPLTLYYFVAVAQCVADRFASWDDQRRSYQGMLRGLAFLRYAETVSASPEVRDGSREVFGGLAHATFRCLRCGDPVSASGRDPDRLWLRAEMECGTCGKVYDLWEVLGSSSPEELR